MIAHESLSGLSKHIGRFVNGGIGSVEILGHRAVRCHQIDHVAEGTDEEISMPKESSELGPDVREIARFRNIEVESRDCADLSDVDEALLIALFGDSSGINISDSRNLITSVETGVQISTIRTRLGQSRFADEVKNLLFCAEAAHEADGLCGVGDIVHPVVFVFDGDVAGEMLRFQFVHAGGDVADAGAAGDIVGVAFK